jgi:DNA-binding MarR family transcriptional regulator
MSKNNLRTRHPDDLLDNTAFLITDVGRLMRRRFDRKMERFGLPRPEWYLLAHLCFFDGSTQQELADAMDVTKGGMAKLVSKLEEKELIRREGEARDGRATKRVYLTDKGWALSLKVDAESIRTVTESVAGLAPDQTAQLHELLRTIRQGLLQSGKLR